VGQYCAPTSDGGVCWPDAAPPTVSGVAVACDGDPCLRDGALTVEAQVADGEELAAVTASLDLDGGVMRLPLTRVAGALHRATLDLRGWPFQGLARTVTATVHAVDGARNEASAGAAGIDVTRVREPVSLEVGIIPTAPALMADGTVVVGDGAKVHFLPPGAAATVPSTVSVGAAILQPPSIGSSAIWVAAGGRVYALAFDGGSVLNGAGYDTGGAIAGPPALTASAATEVAFVASAFGRVVAVEAGGTDGFVNSSGIVDPYVSGPSLDGDDLLYAFSAKASPPAATLRPFTWDGALTGLATRTAGQSITAPLAIAADGSVWAGSADLAASAIYQTLPDGTAGTTIPLGSSAGGGVVVLVSGDVAFCEAATLRRYSPSGDARWTTPPALGGVGLTPLVLTGGDATFLVPTKAGTVHAVSGDGTVLWNATLSPGVELREGNLYREPESPTSTAWFTSADGKLHGLVVDGWLDPAAPWPKAWHDPRNTGNSATPF
jgi:hypothetical protein